MQEANITLLFHDSESEKTIRCFDNTNNQIYIEIENNTDHIPAWICLDVATAIKFSKELRKSIANIKDNSYG